MRGRPNRAAAYRFGSTPRALAVHPTASGASGTATSGLRDAATHITVADISDTVIDASEAMGSEQTGLTPAVFHVLLALEQGALHGYGIMQAVEQTAGVSMGPGTIYGTLQRLSDAGLVEEAGAGEEWGERRRSYRLTRAGRAALKAEARRIAELADRL